MSVPTPRNVLTSAPCATRPSPAPTTSPNTVALTTQIPMAPASPKKISKSLKKASTSLKAMSTTLTFPCLACQTKCTATWVLPHLICI